MTRNAQLVAGSALGFLIVMGLHSCAHAQPPLPPREWTIDARTALAHALLVEGGNDTDRAAIAHVLVRRWRMQRQGWSFEQQVRFFSRPLRVGPTSPRQSRVLSLSWTELPRSLRAFIDRFGRGQVPDPCPDAHTWASRTVYAPSERWRTCHSAVNVFGRRVPR